MKRASVSNWIKSLRLRTLLLSQTCVLVSTSLAYDKGYFDVVTFILTMLTSGMLQIQSNLSNDYGDAVSGVDSEYKKRPLRMVSSGAISAPKMKKAIYFVSFLAISLGTVLIFYALENKEEIIAFFVLGGLALFAATTYSAGKKPYGHIALGDLSVFVFFGWVGIFGVFYLQAQHLPFELYLPASACGLFAVAVLNINNIRDLNSDVVAGKLTVAGMFGFKYSKVYHLLLISLAVYCLFLFVYKQDGGIFEWVFVFSIPMLVFNGLCVLRQKSIENFDPLIRQMVLASFVTMVLFSVGIIS